MMFPVFLFLIGFLAFPRPANTQVPTDIRAGPTSPNSAFMHWKAVPNAPPTARYWYRQLNPTMKQWTSQTVTSLTMDGLISASSYRYQLQYCRTSSSCSATQNIYFRTPPAPSEMANLDKSLPIVSNVIVTRRANSLMVSWRNPVNRTDFGTYDGYVVSWCPGSDCTSAFTFRRVPEDNSTTIEGLEEGSLYTVAVSTTYHTFISRPEKTRVTTKIGRLRVAAVPLSDASVFVFWKPMLSFGEKSLYWLRLGSQRWFSTNSTRYIFDKLQPNTTYRIDTQYCTARVFICGEIRSVTVTTASTRVDDRPVPDVPVPTIRRLNVTCIGTSSFNVTWIGDPTCDSYSGSACRENGYCSSFSSTVERATVTNLLDLTEYNVSVWCVLDDRPGNQMTVTASTKVSSDLANLACVSDTGSVLLEWDPKRRALASDPKVWVMHPVQKKWLSTVEPSIKIENLTSASFYEFEIQYCAAGWQECGGSIFYRAKTLPGINERYDLDRSMQSPSCVNVTTVTVSSADLVWSPVRKAVFYVVEARRCGPSGCPLDLSITSRQTAVQLVGLEDLTKYTVTVRTVKVENGVYFSSSGTEVEITTSPGLLTGLQAFSLFRCIELRWDPKMTNTNHEYQYRKANATIWSRTQSNDVLVFNNLKRGKCYEFEARYCGGVPTLCSAVSNVEITF